MIIKEVLDRSGIPLKWIYNLVFDPDIRQPMIILRGDRQCGASTIIKALALLTGKPVLRVHEGNFFDPSQATLYVPDGNNWEFLKACLIYLDLRVERRGKMPITMLNRTQWIVASNDIREGFNVEDRLVHECKLSYIQNQWDRNTLSTMEHEVDEYLAWLEETV